MRLLLLIAIGVIAATLLTGCTYYNCPGPACGYYDYPAQCGLYSCTDLSLNYYAIDPNYGPMDPYYH